MFNFDKVKLNELKLIFMSIGLSILFSSILGCSNQLPNLQTPITVNSSVNTEFTYQVSQNNLKNSGLKVESQKTNNNILVGTYYFPGWEKKSTNWKIYKDIKIDFPEREPITGWTDISSENYMKNEIGWASKYGVDFFAFDWYWDFKNKKETLENENLDYAIHNFTKVNNNRMKFAIMWANHFELSKNMEDYHELVKFWKTNYFNRKDYLKTNNKPIIYINTFETLFKSLGENGTKEFISYLKTEANAYVICINDIVDYGWQPLAIKNIGFDAITGWSYLNWLKKIDNVNVSSYNSYKAVVEKVWYKVSENNDIPIFPTIMSGWDTSPWRPTSEFKIFNSNPQDFSELVARAQALLEQKDYNLKLMMIGSWNEFGEGSYIIPTKKWGFKYLEAIKRIKEN